MRSKYYRCVGYKAQEKLFTLGKIYEVKDNRITNDNGYVYNGVVIEGDVIKDFLAYYYDFEELSECEEIFIYKNGNKVIATDNSGQIGVARCNTKLDTFDFGVGAKLALDRLIEKYKEYSGKFVVTKSETSYFTVGKIYDVVNGKFYSNEKDNELPLDKKVKIHNINELKEYFEHNFDGVDILEIVK